MIPEHTPVEMVDVEEPVEEPEQTHEAHQHAAAPAGPVAARDVILAALTQRLPCPVCGHLSGCDCERPEGYSPTEAQADLIVQALIEYGHLPAPETPFDPEEVAHWLAERSGFPRYTMDGGWKRLIESERDVELAAFKAQQRVPSDEVEMVKAGKAALLSWHQTKTV